MLTRFECPNFQRAISFQKLLRSSTHHPLSSAYCFNIIAQMIFEISFLQNFIAIFLQRGITQKKGYNPDKKKINVNYFFMRNPYMKFQKPSMHCLKVMLCAKKHDKGSMDERTDTPGAICPQTSSKLGA